MNEVEEAKKRAIKVLEELKRGARRIGEKDATMDAPNASWHYRHMKETCQTIEKRFIRPLRSEPTEDLNSRCLDKIIRAALDMS